MKDVTKCKRACDVCRSKRVRYIPTAQNPDQCGYCCCVSDELLCTFDKSHAPGQKGCGVSSSDEKDKKKNLSASKNKTKKECLREKRRQKRHGPELGFRVPPTRKRVIDSLQNHSVPSPLELRSWFVSQARLSDVLLCRPLCGRREHQTRESLV